MAGWPEKNAFRKKCREQHAPIVGLVLIILLLYECVIRSLTLFIGGVKLHTHVETQSSGAIFHVGCSSVAGTGISFYCLLLDLL